MVKEFIFYIEMLRVKNLEIIKSLGEGQFGEVYLLQDKGTNQQYAIKISKQEFSSFDEKKSFSSSMITWSKINNPAVLSLSSFLLFNFDKENYPIFITKYFSNGSLQNILDLKYQEKAPKKFTNSSQYIILLGVALGMKYLHSHQIYHGNLKPSNILLDQNFYPVINDFYVSSISEYNLSDTLFNSTIEQALYTAPEVFQNSEITEKSDVYSFAILLYELIVSQRPYSDFMSFSTFREAVIDGERPEIFYFNDEDLKQFLSRCWSNDPSERPTFSEVYDKLQSPNITSLFEVDSDEVKLYLKTFETQSKIAEKTQEDPEQAEKLFELGKSSYYGKNVGKQKSLSYLKKSAELGNVSAMALLGKIYEDDVCSPEEAARFYRMAADAGDSASMVSFSRCLTNGIGVQVDCAKSFKYLQMAAEAGEVYACSLLSRHLQAGKDTEADLDKAEYYAKYAVDRGDTPALESYGIVLIQKGRVSEAIPYLKKAANYNLPEALYQLAAITDKKGEHAEAALLYKRSADCGSTKGMYEYALRLLYGRGVKKNQAEAVRYLKIGASKGSLECCTKYGCCLASGTSPNRKEAQLCFRKAADQGDDNAKYFLAQILLTDGHSEEGLRMLEDLSSRGHPRAMMKLGMLLREGKMCGRREKEALALIKASALPCKDLETTCKYAAMVYRGDGFPQDKREAARIMKMVADVPYPKAAKIYAQMLMRGDGVPKNEEEAKIYLEIAERNIDFELHHYKKK